MSETLFRKEALANRDNRLSGELVLSRPLRSTLLVTFLAIVTLVVLCFLSLNRYARKVRVEGLLVPESGVLEVPTPVNGQLQRLFVRQGEQVRAGAALFEIRIDHTLGSGEGLSERLLDSLYSQKAHLEQQLLLQRQAAAQAQQDGDHELQLINASLARLGLMLETEGALLGVRQAAQLRAVRLEEQGLLAIADREAVQAQWLQQKRAQEELELQRLQLRTQRHDALQAQRAARLQHAQQEARLEAERDALEQRIVQAGAEQQTRVSAPLAATVGHVALREGMALSAMQPVISLLPDGVPLHAELQVPSSAIGFLAVGQAVHLRYDSFPYQKFGVQRGHVLEVSRNARLPAEGRAASPVYSVRVVLEAQSVFAYGEAQPLLPGMTLSADIIVDERSLLEWLLEPLYSMAGGR